ncbi:Chromatin modification-related protein EAF1 A [Striga hermonthica]|uniref:Chromatin modification-related protein EAF1 A n=1 Tax=Striga hermonthica TaxID=68872 RepID=A0A9N7MMJ1_STRHE|nr:Chromatin modification-related protein EAF1 A [Striga hermonthica]
MGGAVEDGIGINGKTSPRQAEIEKSQAELRQECEIRDKTKKELEFLLEGGNPLELESGNAASISVQSTSFAEQHADQLVTSEAKGSFAFAASPHGDSVESSGRLGTNPCEPNSADNLLLFDAECELSEGNRMPSHPCRSNIVSSEKLSHNGSISRIGEHGDSTVFDRPRKAYKRRYRSRPNRDGTRSSSTDVNPTHGIHPSSIPSRHEPKDAKGLMSDLENPIILSTSNSKPASPVDNTLQKTGFAGSQQDIEFDGTKAVKPTKDLTEGHSLNSASDAIACEIPFHVKHSQQSPSVLGTPIKMDSDGPQTIVAFEQVSFADIECQPGVTAIKIENKSDSHKMNGFSSKKGERTRHDAHSSASCGVKGLDSESSGTQISQSINGTNDADTKMTDSNGQIKDQISVPDKVPVLGGDESVKEKKESGADSSAPVTVESSVTYRTELEDGVKLHPENELNVNGSALKNKVKDQTDYGGMGASKLIESDSGRKFADLSADQAGVSNESPCSLRHQDSIDMSVPDIPGGGSSIAVSTAPIGAHTFPGSDSILIRTVDEDSILKEAKIIEAKRKRIAELSVTNSPKKTRLKSHWDYLLEEMAWLANDFAQERIWKIASAAQLSSKAAFTCRVTKQESRFHLEAKKVAHSLAKSVMEFWQLIEEKSEVLDQQGQGEDGHSVQAYAMRFRKYKNCCIIYNPTEVPLTPDGVLDVGILDLSWKENLMEENIFYTVLPGTMETYRSSVESHVAQFQKIAGGMIEEVETSTCDAAEDENERTDTYDMSMAFDDSKNSGFGPKKQKDVIHAYGSRPYEVSSDVSHMQGAENKAVHQSALLGKRPVGNLNASIPTKRVRTASRRVVSPFSAGTSGFPPANKTDASSSDTNSYQDDQNILQGGSHTPYNVEVESAVKFEKKLAIGSAEGLMKHKKKKAKHLNAAYEARWQVDSTFQNEEFQRDHLRKSHQNENNCTSGLLGQPMAKKQKTMRQSQDYSFETITPIGGSVPSPVASQMSNMSHSNKFVKMLGGRDRGRKQKLLKMSAGQPGSGSPWTHFEDQALVVLAHDLGPNWELVSDAMNSTLQFKCIFRKSKECKERHSFLMDRTSGDGADSAEDSRSSQPYPSTLPGIPKGSARQLFQRLQGPIEEDTLKSHFEKIIIIGQKQHYRKTQEPKQLQQPHSSHTIALQQVCPNNLNGGPVLGPLDLCDFIAENDILPLGHQGPHSGGLTIPNQGTVTPMSPASGFTSSLQGYPSLIVGSNFPSSPSSLNSSLRDARYGPPRPALLPADEQQRMQQYNQMSGRSVPQPNASSPGALAGTERGVRVLPGGSGMGLVSGVNRGMSITRPGFQGITSPPVVNSGSVVSPGMPPPNMHSGVGSGQGSSILRPREALHMMRPGLGQDSQRPIMPADLQMQAPPGNSQMSHHISGLSSPLPNQTVSPLVPSYPLHHPSSPQHPQVLSPRHHPHLPGPTTNQQAYAMRLAKERQQQNRSVHQPQISLSNSTTPHNIHPSPQLPLQNNPQVQPQMATPPVSLSPTNSMNQQAPVQGNAPVGSTHQITKQRQRQKQNQSAQANRPHPQQKQQTQSQQLANKNKVAKGVGRGNSLQQPNVSIDRAPMNGVSATPGKFVPPQKNYPGQGAPSTKNLHHVASLTDKNSLGHVQVPGSNHPQTSSHQKSVTTNQLHVQRVVQQPNRPQAKDPSNDKHLTSSSTELDQMMTLPPSTVSASAHQWQASEPILDQTTLGSGTNTSSVPLKASGSAAQNSQQ